LLALYSERGTGCRASERLAEHQAHWPSTNYRIVRLGLAIALAEGRDGNEMLRITVEDEGTLCRLHLAGRLAGAWVAETEKTWRSAPVSGRPVEIDMREVTGIDQAGLCLLQAMNQAGARFIAKGVAMEALVEEITGKPARHRRRA
jgi:hypothetical protein